MCSHIRLSHIAGVNSHKENLRHVKAVSHTLPQIFFMSIHTCQYRTLRFQSITLCYDATITLAERGER